MQDVKIDREKYIGGSDIPIILNLSEYKSRFELLQEKAGIITPEDTSNDYTIFGNVIEPKVRDYVNENCLLEGETMFEEDKLIDGDIRCHFDGCSNQRILEVKSTSNARGNTDSYYVYLSQLLFYMMCKGYKKGLLAIYERPEDVKDYTFSCERVYLHSIDIDNFNDLVDTITEEVSNFRNDLNLIKENPLLSEEELQNKEVVAISKQIISILDTIAEYKKINTQYEVLKDNLLEAMEKHKIKSWEIDNYKITRIVGKPNSSEMQERVTEKFNMDKFKEENPEMYERYVETSKELVNVVTSGRKGSIRITEKKKKG